MLEFTIVEWVAEQQVDFGPKVSHEFADFVGKSSMIMALELL